MACTDGWKITGYFLPESADFNRSTQEIHVAGRSFTLPEKFLASLKMAGWGLITGNRYLGWQRGWALTRARALIPEVSRLFSGMKPEKADKLAPKILGRWTFFAYSEQRRDRVCRGAIEFGVTEGGDFTARELQQDTVGAGRHRTSEVHTGTFFFRKNSMVVVLRDEEDFVPKFYVLSVEQYPEEQGLYAEMMGAMHKVGAKQDVYAGKVVLLRNDNAFDECAMISSMEVSDDIRGGLD